SAAAPILRGRSGSSRCRHRSGTDPQLTAATRVGIVTWLLSPFVCSEPRAVIVVFATSGPPEENLLPGCSRAPHIRAACISERSAGLSLPGRPRPFDYHTHSKRDATGLNRCPSPGVLAQRR